MIIYSVMDCHQWHFACEIVGVAGICHIEEVLCAGPFYPVEIGEIVHYLEGVDFGEADFAFNLVFEK